MSPHYQPPSEQSVRNGQRRTVDASAFPLDTLSALALLARFGLFHAPAVLSVECSNGKRGTINEAQQLSMRCLTRSQSSISTAASEKPPPPRRVGVLAHLSGRLAACQHFILALIPSGICTLSHSERSACKTDRARRRDTRSQAWTHVAERDECSKHKACGRWKNQLGCLEAGGCAPPRRHAPEAHLLAAAAASGTDAKSAVKSTVFDGRGNFRGCDDELIL